MSLRLAVRGRGRWLYGHSHFTYCAAANNSRTLRETSELCPRYVTVIFCTCCCCSSNQAVARCLPLPACSARLGRCLYVAIGLLHVHNRATYSMKDIRRLQSHPHQRTGIYLFLVYTCQTHVRAWQRDRHQARTKHPWSPRGIVPCSILQRRPLNSVSSPLFLS